ncbi:MAG: hypothetical protein WCW87_04215 [Candidatus Paceibacterota bacterium]
MKKYGEIEAVKLKLQKRMIEQIDERNEILEKTNYGKLIIQSNNVQYYLSRLIFLRSFNSSKKFEEKLNDLSLGPLIGYLNVCAQTKQDLDLIIRLKNYKDKRDALAHRMLTDEKLTPEDCKKALETGKEIIKYLIESLKQKYMIKGTDKISDFPIQFNKLAKLVESLEKRIIKLEQGNKKLKENS